MRKRSKRLWLGLGLTAIALCLLIAGLSIWNQVETMRNWLLYGYDNQTAEERPTAPTFDIKHWMLSGWNHPFVDTGILEAFDPYAQNLDFLSVNFSSLPRIDSSDMLLSRLTYARCHGYRQLPLRLAPDFSIESMTGTLGLFDWTCRYTLNRTLSVGDRYVLLSFDYPPGVSIADAYLRGTPETLSEREHQTYTLAMAFVNDSDFVAASRLEQERRIHDYLCERLVYWNGPDDAVDTDFRTAVGAILDGRGNCMAYTDAFAMLARMAGFQCYTVTGTALSADGSYQPHAWNQIQIENGWYFVDVTYDDVAHERHEWDYTYFNVGTRHLSATHQWDTRTLMYPVDYELDAQYAYGNPSFPDLLRARDEAALTATIITAMNDPSRSHIRIFCDYMPEAAADYTSWLQQQFPSLAWQYLSTRLGDALCLNVFIYR